MKHWKLSLYGFSIYFFSHIALVPILSYFGLNACPLLNEKGFYFGCSYSLRFVTEVLFLQSAVIAAFFYVKNKNFKNHKFKYYFLNYFSIFQLTSHFSIFYFLTLNYEAQLFEITDNAYLVKSFVWLCMILITITTWKWVDTEANIAIREHLKTINRYKNEINLKKLWILDSGKQLIPVIGVILFFGFYFMISFNIQPSWDHPQKILANEKEKFLYLSFIVLIWQISLYSFEFYKNLYFIKQIDSHLSHIQNQNFKFLSVSYSSGFYGFIFNLLNQLSEALAKKGRLLKGFSAFVSETVAQDILNNDHDVHSGENKKIAIMMADIRDFTHLSSHLKPQEVVDLLNIYFSDMIEVFIEHGVILDKYIGDGLLAYIPVDPENPNAAYENLLKASFDMHLKLQKTNAHLKLKKLPKIRLGIALHEGNVIIGSIGSKQKLQHTIIGDPVNVTTRLESLCKDLSVGLVVSSNYLHFTNSENRIKFMNMGKHSIRGIDLPIEVYGALPYEKKQMAA